MKHIIVSIVALLIVSCAQSYKHIVVSDASDIAKNKDGKSTQCIYDGVKYSLGAVIRQDDRNLYLCENTNPKYQDKVTNAFWQSIEKDQLRTFL